MTMKVFYLILPEIFLFFSGHCYAEVSSNRSDIDIFSYYELVDGQSLSPPPEQSLRTICQKKRKDGGYITFIGVEGRKVLLFALTDNKIRDASKSVYLETRFFTGPKVLLRISGWGPGVTPDWGYVFDRNRDGMVDYLAYMAGPKAVAPLGHKEELPNITATKRKTTLGEEYFKAGHSPLTFWHVADDNFDGSVDGFAMRADRVDNGWSYGWMVVQSSSHNDIFDKCQYYSGHDKNESHSCEPVDEGHGYVVLDKYKAHSLPVEMYDKWLLTVNNGINECKLDAANFYALPGTFNVSEETKKSTDWSDDSFLE